MLKHSVQIELFLILWVTKLIYSESPMCTVLDKDTIKNEILPHLSKAKRGYVTQSCLIEVVNAILYKLKTGCQWAFLPVEALFGSRGSWVRIPLPRQRKRKFSFFTSVSGCSAVRLAHQLWELGVVGSNPATPTKKNADI